MTKMISIVSLVCVLILDGIVSQGCVDECRDCSASDGYCYVCNDGMYGDKCSLNCTFADNCRDNLCEASGLKCSYKGCVNGRYGAKCDKLCPISCPGARCVQETGKCTSCPTGKYGIHCTHDCSERCPNTVCVQDDGRCIVPCTDRHNCRNDICDGASGECYGCEYGMSGRDCNVPCDPNNCADNRCDRYISGKCEEGVSCLHGWYGEGCDLPCNLTNCASLACNRQTGTCTRCKTSFFGTNCEKICNVEQCWYNCDRTTGECFFCMYGPHSYQCARECPSCLSGLCRYSERCIGSYFINGTQTYCKPGYYGEYCLKCLNTNCSTCNNGLECTSCIAGLYGTSCDKNCSFNCIHTDDAPQCDMATGACLHSCYYGNGCVSSCNDIADHCSDCSRTKTSSLVCMHCEKGFYTAPENDENERRTCLPCGRCINGTCPYDTGICPDGCFHGYWGDRCDRTCAVGCMICDKQDGTCQLTVDKLDGYRSISESSSMPYVVGGNLGGVGVVSLVIAIVIIIKARNMKGKNENAPTTCTYHTNMGVKGEEHYSSGTAKKNYKGKSIRLHEDLPTPTFLIMQYMYHRYRDLLSLQALTSHVFTCLI